MFYRFRYFRRARALALTSDEKDAARRELLTFMEAHPVRTTAAARPLAQRSNSVLSFLSPVLKPVPIVAAALLLVGAGTASAAEGALPDSPLYFVKVNVTEPLRRSLAISAEAKAEVEASLTARRLDEAKALAEQDRLTPSVQAELEARFKEQADRAEAKILAVKEEGDTRAAADLSARYEAKLRVRQDALDRLSERPIDAKAAIAPVLDTVRLKTEAATRQRERLKVDIDATAKIDQKQERVASEKWKEIALEAQVDLTERLTEAEKERSHLEAAVMGEALMKVDARLAAAKQAAAKGQAFFRAGAYADASDAFRDAKEALREAQAFVRQARKAEQDVPRDKPKEEPLKEERKPIIRPRRDLPVKILPETKQDPDFTPPADVFFEGEIKIDAPDRSKAELDQKTP